MRCKTFGHPQVLVPQARRTRTEYGIVEIIDLCCQLLWADCTLAVNDGAVDMECRLDFVMLSFVRGSNSDTDSLV